MGNSSNPNNLNETQLLLLDNLIYLEGVADQNNKTLGQVIDNLTKNNYAGLNKSRDLENIGKDDEWPCAMTREEWIQVLEAAKNDPKLRSLRITNGVTQEKTVTSADGKTHDGGGMRAATFVDDLKNEATVVFRGTHGSYEWHDNGTGGYLSDTTQQQLALDYINSLPDYNYLTVTGHSKGGNKSQYVTIMSDKVDWCVSFDGQGFSKEFIDAHRAQIEANAHKITSISAASDFVNCLLNTIAPNRRYIDTPSEGKNFHHYHCPNILLKFVRDENGNIVAVMRDDTEQSAISRLVNKFTVYVNTKVEDPKRREAINGLIAKFFEGDAAGESIADQEKALELLKEIAIQFAKEELTLKDVVSVLCQDELHDMAFAMIREKFGPLAELAATGLLSMLFPPLFIDDFLHAVITDIKILANIALEKIKQLGNFIVNTLEKIGNKMMDFAKGIGRAFSNFATQVRTGWENVTRFVNGLYNDIVETGKRVVDAVDNFRKRAAAAISNFFQSVADGARRVGNFFRNLGRGAVNTWNRAMDRASDGVHRVVNGAREEVKKRYEQFKEGTGRLVSFTKRTLEKAGEKGISLIRNFGKKVARGLGTIASARISVDLFRLADLQNKMRNLEHNFGERVHQILNEANRVASDVGRSYSEYYVQQQIHAISRTCDRIKESNRRVCDALQRKINSLQYAVNHYNQIENVICREIIM